MSGNGGLWEPWYRGEAFPYGPDLTYRMGAEFLRDCPTIDDWGCGAQWFRRVMAEVNPATQVRGIDGSAGKCDHVAELITYRPKQHPAGIFMRHVLEHNYDWRLILDNALDSFAQELFVVNFMDFAPDEREALHHVYEFPTGGSCPYLQLPQAEFEAMIDRRALTWQSERLASPGTEFGVEIVYRISQRN